MAKQEVSSPEFVGGLAKGLAVIEAFDAAQSEMTLSEVARRAGITPAAARRSLHTLVALGYVRHVNKRFLLSARVLHLGAAYLRAAHVEELLLPELRRLVALFGDAASVSVLDGDDILYIAHHSAERANRIFAGVGVTYPAYPTSMGRVLLAGLPAAALDAYLSNARLEQLTEFTVTDRGALRAIVAKARREGFGTAVDELDYGITALAVPIDDADGNVVAALNSSGYSGRIDIELMIAERLSELRVSAARMSQALARHPTLARSTVGNWPAPGRVLKAAE
jgi:IclR family transcriptional regulator, pca regulon regulatory protein